MCSVVLFSEDRNMSFSKTGMRMIRVRGSKVTFYLLILTFIHFYKVFLAMKWDLHLVASGVTEGLLNSMYVTDSSLRKNDPCSHRSFQNNMAVTNGTQNVGREKLKWTHPSYEHFPIYLRNLMKITFFLLRFLIIPFTNDTRDKNSLIQTYKSLIWFSYLPWSCGFKFTVLYIELT